MTRAQTRKILELSLEFDQYAFRHPEIYDQIPRNAWLVMTDAKDEKFSKASRNMLLNAKDIERYKAMEARKEGRRWRVVRLEKA